MNSEFATSVTVQSLIARGLIEIGDGYRAKRSELSSDGLPFARAGNIDGGIRLEDAEILSRNGVEKAGNKVSRPGDVVFTSKGTVGRFALVNCATPRFVYSPQLCYWRSLDSSVLDSRFLFYWMKSPEFLAQVAAVKGQTDMADYVSLRDQRRMVLTVPEVAEQRRIAAILGALDDKIELNRKMSRTLEEIAQTLFQAWFVDFQDFPATDRRTDQLPEGWGRRPIGELVETVGGGTPSTKVSAYWEGGDIHWTTPKDLSSLSSPVLLDTSRKITSQGLARISSGLLPKGTVLLSSRAPVGYTAIAQYPLAINQGYIALLPNEKFTSLYLLFWLRANLERIRNRAGGTTFREISKRNFRSISALDPPSDWIARFDEVVEPLFARIVLNERESRTLAALRDTLLPKLISGEIRVPEAERLVEEVR